MLDLEPTTPSGGQQDGWQDIVTSRLFRLAPEIAYLTDTGHDADAVQFGLEKAGHQALSLEVRLGDKRAYIKLYHDTPEAQAAYARDRGMHVALRDTGLTPGLIAFSDTERFVMTEHVDSMPWDEAMRRFGPERIARNLGAWLAQCDNQAPTRPGSGNWYDYLSQFGDEVPQAALQPTADVLAAIPVDGLVVSRGDPALHNYLITDDGNILGCDFEAARLRPRGWDFAMAHHTLLRHDPDQADLMIYEMGQGFSDAHKGDVRMDQLYGLTSALTLTMALRGRAN